MIKSMTGYGKAVNDWNGNKISVEIRSLNSKQLDLTLRLPSLFKEKELEIRAILQPLIERGKCEVIISLENNTSTCLNTHLKNDTVIKYYNEIKQIADELKINTSESSLHQALHMAMNEKEDCTKCKEEEFTILLNTLDEAMDQFNAFRLHEGKVLEKDFKQRIDFIKNTNLNIEKLEPVRIAKIKEKLSNQFKNIFEKAISDENRLEQELFYYLERFDITEERIRLEKHLDLFISSMQQEENQGKKLGFICQEIGREINTLGSKANDAEIQHLVVQMKDELEKIKEQLCNVL